MNLDHTFEVGVEWTGNRGTGTSGPRDFGREHVVVKHGLAVAGKPSIDGSAAPAFHGDRDRWNPEELLLGSLAQCHLLSYLYVATREGIVVESYEDSAVGTLQTNGDGSGAFTSVTLHPVVTISAGDPAVARELHAEANRLCFIAGSVNFPVRHEPTILLADDEA